MSNPIGLRKETASSCFSASSPADDHKAKVRASLAKIDPGLLPFLDAAKGTFGDGVKLEGLQATQPDGTVAGTGTLGPDADAIRERQWQSWREQQR